MGAHLNPELHNPEHWQQLLGKLCHEFAADSATLFVADPLGQPQRLIASHQPVVAQVAVQQLTLTGPSSQADDRVQLWLQRNDSQFSGAESDKIAQRLQQWQRQWQQQQLLQHIEDQVYHMMWTVRWRQPLMVVDCDGKIQHGNGAFERLLKRDWLTVQQQQLRLAERSQQRQLLECMEQLRQSNDGQARQLLLGNKRDSWRLDLHGMIDGANQILLQFTEVTVTETGGALLSVIRLFNLSPQEGRVAMKIASGVPAKVIAADFHVEESTIRTHIRHILRKTQCRNQMELVGRLNRILM
ncbi:helix-turn-helix transcriptional regulator [Ferrimonas senticii]|uniref:helix-turn-helix transcriptional regulator n=1 Tax=Ferrimonas senticii TaxID=394566 RepID=UPI000419B065|nr:helix-turn-helix transcriptional regulator [Ferrimonas senticii]